MPRSTLRFFAIIVLVLLGAPVAMHVVLHDLHGHDDEATGTYASAADHGDHEHPIVSSPAPTIPGLVQIGLPVAAESKTVPLPVGMPGEERNTLTHGALRMDDDVGLQSLLSTFLI